MKVVLDTNVIVSAHLSPHGAPAQILEHWRQRRFDLCVSEAILSEYRRALQYDRVAARHRLGEHDIAALIEGFRRFASYRHTKQSAQSALTQTITSFWTAPRAPRRHIS